MLQQTNVFVAPSNVQITIDDQEGKKNGGEGGEKLPDPPLPAGTPPKAWEEHQCFRMDLSESRSNVSFYTSISYIATCMTIIMNVCDFLQVMGRKMDNQEPRVYW